MLITLHSNGYEVAVNTMGAELKSFKDPSGKEYVWNSDPAFWMRSSPLLFPTIGNLRNGETTMKGQVYPLVKHGFCKDTEFEVKDLSDDTVTFLLHANEETLKSYPCLLYTSRFHCIHDWNKFPQTGKNSHHVLPSSFHGFQADMLHGVGFRSLLYLYNHLLIPDNASDVSYPVHCRGKIRCDHHQSHSPATHIP